MNGKTKKIYADTSKKNRLMQSSATVVPEASTNVNINI